MTAAGTTTGRSRRRLRPGQQTADFLPENPVLLPDQQMPHLAAEHAERRIGHQRLQRRGSLVAIGQKLAGDQVQIGAGGRQHHLPDHLAAHR